MKNIILISGLTLLLFVHSGCSKKDSEAKSMEQLYSENGIPVKVEKVVLRSVEEAHRFHGLLTGYRESSASASLADKVETIHYSVGDYVEKAAVVISFPTTNPAAQYSQAKVAYEHAEATLKRMKNLYESGGISLQDYENTQAQFRVAEANWNAVRQAVQVLAPISGVITQITVQETENVQPGDKLFTISQTDRLKAKIWVTEEEVGHIRVNNPAGATWKGKELTGKVVQVDMALNPQMQAFGVVVEFDNSGERIPSGVNAEITILRRDDEKIIKIDRKNIIEKENKMVFVAEGNVAKQRVVETGRILGLDVEITRGLNPGDLLITEGQFLLNDGDKINIIQ